LSAGHKKRKGIFMKKNFVKRFIAALAVLAFIGCSQPNSEDNTSVHQNDLTKEVRISIGKNDGIYKTLLPSTPVFTRYSLLFTPNGGQNAPAVNPVSISAPTSNLLINLEYGSWTVSVTGYVQLSAVGEITAGEYAAAMGNRNFTLSATEPANSTVDVTISGAMTSGEPGVFSWAPVLPNGYSALVMNIYDSAGGIVLYGPVDLFVNQTGNVALDAGSYAVDVSAVKDSITSSLYGDAFQIYTNHITKMNVDFSPYSTVTTFTSIADLSAWLLSQPANTVATAYSVTLTGVNLDANTGWSSLGSAIGESKYVSLDLSGCTGTTIPHQTYYYDGIFYNAKLTGIVLPQTLTTIGGYAFCECDYLVAVTIPASVTSIGDYAFLDNPSGSNSNVHSNFETVIVSSTMPPVLGTNTFSRYYSAYYSSLAYLKNIYVPEASLSSYKATTNWSSYSSYIQAYTGSANGDRSLVTDISYQAAADAASLSGVNASYSLTAGGNISASMSSSSSYSNRKWTLDNVLQPSTTYTCTVPVASLSVGWHRIVGFFTYNGRSYSQGKTFLVTD
jgi:hypothetical protein